MRYFFFLSIWVLLIAHRADAEFSESVRSINGTGETLPKGQYELGSTGLSYGVRDDILIQAPATSLIFARGAIAAKYKTRMYETRLTPFIELGNSAYIAAGTDIGRNFGPSLKHSVTITPKLYLQRRSLNVNGQIVKKLVLSLELNGEYDFYYGGNLAFAGLQASLPFLGYTWGFSSFYCGLVASPLSNFIPLPFAYWRF